MRYAATRHDAGMTVPLLRCGLALVVAGALAPAAAAAPTKSASLCSPSEVVVFSCGAGGRLASICASAGLTKVSGTMQYRFGAPGRIELAYPATPGKLGDNFKGGWMSYSGGGGAYVRFANGPFEYTVFSATGKWGANGGSLDVAGVAIRKDGKDFSNFVCRGLADDLGELGPDFLQKMGMSGADPDLDFAPPEAFLKK
jgi:hypothetical protein